MTALPHLRANDRFALVVNVISWRLDRSLVVKKEGSEHRISPARVNINLKVIESRVEVKT